jgi:hypothetical protein
MDSEKHRAELHSLFYEASYSRGDIVLATELTEKALEHMTRPGGPLRWAGGSQQGRPRKYTGHDILMIEVMRRLSLFGVPWRASLDARDAVSQRVSWVLGGLVSPNAEYGLVLYPYKTPDHADRTEWACIGFTEGQPEPWSPPACLTLAVDRVIHETIAKLRALRDGTEMPRFHPLFEAARYEAARAAASNGKPKRDFLNVATEPAKMTGGQ